MVAEAVPTPMTIDVDDGEVLVGVEVADLK
jgi:hypothetical protein